MTEIEQATLYAEISLGRIQCGTDKCNDVATDYIVQPIGRDDKVSEELVVPVCQECIDYLDSTEWVLLYCVQCNSSHWVNKSLSKMKYGPLTIFWMDNCPKC